MFFSTEVALNPPCVAFIDMDCYYAYGLFKTPCVHDLLFVGGFFSEPATGFGVVTDNPHFKVYGFQKLKDNLPDWTPDTYPTNFCCLFEAPLNTRKINSNLFKVWSIQFREKETDSPITPDEQKIEKTLDAVDKLNPGQPAQESSKQLTRVSLPAFLVVGFDEDSMSLVVKSVPSVFTEIQQHKAQFEQLVGCLIQCTPSPPLKRGDCVIYRSNKYYIVPNGNTCYLYTDLATMTNHDPKVKNWQYTPRISCVKFLSGTRTTPGPTPISGHTKQGTTEHETTASVPAPDVTPAPAPAPAPASAPTSTPATRPATESAKSINS